MGVYKVHIYHLQIQDVKQHFSVVLCSKPDQEVFPNEVQKRENLGQTYSEGLANLEGLETPRIGEFNTSVYAQYTILSEHRENIQQLLTQDKTQTKAVLKLVNNKGLKLWVRIKTSLIKQNKAINDG